MMLPVVLTLHVLASTAAPSWQRLAPGLELGHIHPRPHTRDAGELEVVRADPRLVRAELATVAQTGGDKRTASAWADQVARPGDVVVVTNAGMFATDHRSHTGYLEAPGVVLTPKWNAYQSVFAFDPTPATPGEDELPSMRLLERDDPAHRALLQRYRGRAQNLRLIAAPGRNKWTRNDRAWSEAALAMDRRGRVLIVFAREPHQMVDFNARILAQLDVVSAQHLEGGPEASLSIRAPRLQLDRAGSFETGFFDDSNTEQWPLPNVIVLRARARGP